MDVTNITDLNTTNDYDNNTDLYTTNDYGKITGGCTDNENNIDIIIASILLTIPCGLPFLCLMSLIIYKLIKPLKTNK